MRDIQRHRQREKQAPYGEPDVGLDPRILGSQPEPKADTQPEPPRHPHLGFFIYKMDIIICNNMSSS